MTEFEIEETVAMVQKWIKKGWFTPMTKRPQLPSSGSDSDEHVNRLIKPASRRMRPVKRQFRMKTPPKEKRVQKPNNIAVGKFDLFKDSDTEHESEDTIII